MDIKLEPNKKRNITLIGIVLIIALLVIIFNINTDKNTVKIFNYEKVKYNAEEEIKAALIKLTENDKKANLITDIDTVDKKIALTFEGLADADTMKEILTLLDEYNMKATFFVPGMQSAEDEDAVLMIKKAGQEIGSYSLSAKKHMETLSQDEIVKDLSLTNVILREIIGKEPDILKCNVTTYTDHFLNTVRACGISRVVQSKHYLSFQSFSSYNMAHAYVEGLERGSIISIKLTGTLDEEEYEAKEKDTSPAIEKQGDIKGNAVESKEEVQIVQIVEWLSKSINTNNYSTEFIKDFPAYQDPDFNRDYGAFRKENKGKLAKVYKGISTISNLVAYSFRGIEDEKMLNKILTLLHGKQIKATFFVTGNEVIDYPKRIQKILAAGHTVGNGGLTGDDLISMDFENIYFEIWKTHKILQEKGISTKVFMPANGKYNDTVREAVNTLGYSLVTYNRNPIRDKEASVDNIMKYFTKGFSRGDVIYFRLDYYDDLDQAVLNIDEGIKKAGYSVVDIQTLLENESLVNNLSTLSEISDNRRERLEAHYQRLKNENKGIKSKILTNLYTTQPAVTFVFRGVSNKDTLDRALQVLDDLGVKGSFFVTGKEIINYPENVREIINRDHEIHNGGYGVNISNPGSLDFNSLCYEIEMGEQCLRAFLGEEYIEKVNSYYMPLYADTEGDVLEAASALGYKEVVTYNRSAMIEAYQNLSADEIVADYFSNILGLHRGDIVYFRLDYLMQKGAIEELMEKIAKYYIKPSTYDIVSVNKLINSDLVYEPVSRTAGVGSELVKTTHGYGEEYLLNYIFNRYIGNRSISTSNELIGFSNHEIAKIDKTGEIDTKGEKVIFLTFDDWGSDKAIMRLMNVLNKYDVKATFFVRVGNSTLTLQDKMINPNLLRAIALDGHDIGNHTFGHMKINIETDVEESLLREDIVAAHQEMARYIGDTGSLKLFFRPPTLAVSKLGLKTIFDCGYQYIINGDFSTHDYTAENAEELIDKLKNGMGNRKIGVGTIVVMHMSDNSKFTAEALDIVIPYYQAQGYRFAKLSDFLK